MNALYLVVMLVIPPCTTRASCEPKAEVHLTYKKADAERSLAYGARVWKIFPSLKAAELRAGSGGVIFQKAVKIK